MSKTRSGNLLELSDRAQAALLAGARDTDPVKGLTHGFYKYPARFSPAFVRAAIKTFTQPGDLVLDNHVGGGTTLVEALAGRHAIGVDISTLAEFVATVKTTVYSEAELERLDAWSKRVADAIDIHKSSIHFEGYAELGYYKHLEHPSRWRLRKAIEQGIGSALRMYDQRLESFGRCAVLRTAQWALDGRKNLPSVDEFRAFLEDTATDMVAGARALRAIVVANRPRPIVEQAALGVFASFFRRLAELGQAKDPFASWRLKLPRRGRLPRALDRSESMILLNCLDEPTHGVDRDRHTTTIFRLLVATGLRVGELCGLKISDVSSDCAVVRVHGKGSRDRVAYVADPSLSESLKRLVASQRPRNHSDGPLLINRFGAPMKPQSIRSKLRRFAAEAGLQRRVTPHMLRHTAATLLIETGVDIRFVQRLLGHSSIATTEIYTHVTDEALRATLERANILESLRM